MFDFIKDKKIIIFGVSLVLLSVISISFAIYFYMNKPTCDISSNEVVVSLKEEMVKEDIDDSFFVEVKGAVKKTGVFLVTSKQIINDVIILAGGFKSTAYTDNINLSKSLSKEMVIYVYTKNEYKKLNISSKKEIKECVINNYVIDECTDKGSSMIETNSSLSTNDSEIVENDNNPKLININTATKEELMTLSGIGESKAINIINYRTEKGLFKDIQDIKNVSGIGDSIYEQIKASITV